MCTIEISLTRFFLHSEQISCILYKLQYLITSIKTRYELYGQAMLYTLLLQLLFEA